jgi:hypothetical protein
MLDGVLFLRVLDEGGLAVLGLIAHLETVIVPETFLRHDRLAKELELSLLLLLWFLHHGLLVKDVGAGLLYCCEWMGGTCLQSGPALEQ